MEEQQDAYVEGYRLGYREGYAKGHADGHSTGFMDAKVRVYASLSATNEDASRRELTERIRITLGAAS